MAKTFGDQKCIAVLLVAVLLVSVGCEKIDDNFPSGDSNVAANTGAAPDVGGGDGGGDGGGEDGISLNGVVWLSADVSGWPQTATLNARVGGGRLHLPHDKANAWPTTRTRARNGGPLNGNCWVFVQVNGTWHAATFDWMRTGQTSKSVDSVRGTGGHIPQAPLNTWRPRSGETYGFMVSTPARTGERTINERSNVSMVTWP